MFFDPMPIVHVYPHDMWGETGHTTDDSHECWCEPRVAIVPPGHQFSKEDNTTRVFYHSSYVHKHDWQHEASAEEIKLAIPINKLLRSITSPPKNNPRLAAITELLAFIQKTDINAMLPNFIFDPEARIAGTPGAYICTDCNKRVEKCKCDQNRDDNDLTST
jgi:hypothetical protein